MIEKLFVYVFHSVIDAAPKLALNYSWCDAPGQVFDPSKAPETKFRSRVCSKNHKASAEEPS